jgi:hypothetical protein
MLLGLISQIYVETVQLDKLLNINLTRQAKPLDKACWGERSENRLAWPQQTTSLHQSSSSTVGGRA